MNGGIIIHFTTNWSLGAPVTPDLLRVQICANPDEVVLRLEKV